MAVWCTCYGIVTLRQQPQTAKGVLFVSREDTTGVVQIIVCKSVRERGAAAIEAAGRAGARAARLGNRRRCAGGWQSRRTRAGISTETAARKASAALRQMPEIRLAHDLARPIHIEGWQARPQQRVHVIALPKRTSRCALASWVLNCVPSFARYQVNACMALAPSTA